MITLAFDTATDHCTVAATDGQHEAAESLDGARRHAGAVLTLIDAVLASLGATPRDIGCLVTADGPGSFTGLRVSASVAKALVWGRQLEWRVAPSLLVRAAAHALREDTTVLALADALRGEVYAGCWCFAATGIRPVDGPPRAVHPSAVARFGAVDRVVGTISEAMLPEIERVTGRAMIRGDGALPDARMLLRLAGMPGGTTVVDDAGAWEPEYGRPAEAQAVWERTHGRPLRAPSDRTG